MISNPSVPSLYEDDYVAWLDTTLNQLKNHDIEQLDWDNLTEEIEALGREQRHKVESYLLRLLIHLLLYQYWHSEKEWSGKGWEKEIDNFRLELDLLLESKVLFNHLTTILEKDYQKARKSAIRKSKLSPEIFPLACPYILEQILDPDWLP
ncbi:slr2128 [Synechocystis sp. PCC 6803]|uniref:Slr2128 protein n=1 Tax=Synechocystis sp. (strain ATCC 27184 / PCC 6803 / Kazusa) TaxID=1111708 RepID=P73995_SYNY3|nr:MULTISPECIES: DUF29 domain-containing protein [unclassified Synechocystis]BAM51813.1 hypothetical protein BEST7613_2882 [Synechocystis sp. PCC 6803] [Bacillus subtilis BEST7613]AGF51753.1 hypothetical protein MYO_115030 [Synechocystis sp. PCC 6803]ALJ67743.1 hypothetical protein AOY38_07715 [Synechocystis sp. PCC 6803]AVP89574.1 DUF29 domain-containing protein [Synechocystis sp. IPPAS B-1465]MBD2618700.1 DUF29 domain-containing protein [Synechocystis sp. FACHB-898]